MGQNRFLFKNLNYFHFLHFILFFPKFAPKTCPFIERKTKCRKTFCLSFLFGLHKTLYLFIFDSGVCRMKKESSFQSGLIKEIKDLFPECIVMKNDSKYIQGIPDLLVLHGKHWASLECKKSSSAHKQPNQSYYVEKMNSMSFSRFVSPENKEDVLHELQSAFQP